jgi:hypothetical protein
VLDQIQKAGDVASKARKLKQDLDDFYEEHYDWLKHDEE